MNANEALAMMDRHYELLTARGIDTAARKKRFEMMLKLWKEFPLVRASWELVENAKHYAKRFIRKIADLFNLLPNRRKGKYDAFIDWECVPIDNAEVFYLLQIRDNATRELIASKVGTSGGVVERLRDEVKEYTKSYEKQVRLVVQRCVRCLDHAQTIRAESTMRAHYIGKYGSDCFKDNDRFNGVEFDLLEADKILSEIPGLWA